MLNSIPATATVVNHWREGRLQPERSGTDIKWAPGTNVGARVPLLASDWWANNAAISGDPITIESLAIDGNVASNPTEGDGLVIRSYGRVIQDLDIDNFPATV